MDFKKEAAKKALTLIQENTVIGLGAGSTIAHVVTLLKEARNKGMFIQILTSSFTTKQLLQESGLAVSELSSAKRLAVYFDGCDQFDKDLHALKSGGGIHTHEKLLASLADEFVLIGDEAKYVERLETKYPIVVEVIPEALHYVIAKAGIFFEGAVIKLRTSDKTDGPVITHNGNYLLDIWVKEWPELSTVNPALKSITGVLETSLFYNLAAKAIIGTKEGILFLDKKDGNVLTTVSDLF